MSRARGVRAKTMLASAVVLAVILSSLLVVGSSAGTGSRECLGRKATILGTSGNDNIYGTNGSDVVVGGRGEIRSTGSVATTSRAARAGATS